MPTWEIERNGKVIGEIESDQPPDRRTVLRAMAALDRQSVLPKTFGAPEPAPQKTIGSHVADAGRAWWDVVNPMNVVHAVNQAVLPEQVGEMFGYQKSGPINTLNAVTGQVVGGVGKAIQEPQYAASHLMNATPVVGPMSRQVAKNLEAGEYGQAAGTMAGVATAVGATPPRLANAAQRLERGVQKRMTNVMAPRAGTSVGRRMGNQAQRVAPQMARDLVNEGAPLTKEHFHADVRARLGEAKQGLDAAADQRLAARSVQTQPIIDALKERLAKITMESDKGTAISYQQINVKGTPATTWIKNRGPIGKDVIPRPSNPRADMIQGAIDELEQLGPTTVYEELRKMRQSYDGPAQIKYLPSTYDDALKGRGASTGAAEVTSVLRDKLADLDPTTAQANAQYHLYQTADDVMTAAAEIERARPKVGRQIMGRLTGMMLGSHAGGAGAAAGYLGGPLIDSALASGVTTQLKTARHMQQLADAVRSGNLSQVDRLIQALQPGKVGIAGRGVRPVPSHAVAEDQEPER